jgi:2-polyprenyl-3-methyl-5-hydroxy-6-metoxy-1,4-benzoquinol methylase
LSVKKSSKYERRGAYHWRELEHRILHYNAMLAARYNFILKAAPKKPSLVLDFGCGDGYLSYRLAKNGHRVIGCDISMTSLRLAIDQIKKQNDSINITFIRNSENLPFPEEIFDFVVLADVIEHVPQPSEVLFNLHQVLKPGGRLLLSTPSRIEGRTWDKRHYKEYSESELQDLVKQIFSRYETAEQQPYIFCKLYMSRFWKLPISQIKINLLSFLGLNVFSLSRKPLSRLKSCQLYAICTK